MLVEHPDGSLEIVESPRDFPAGYFPVDIPDDHPDGQPNGQMNGQPEGRPKTALDEWKWYWLYDFRNGKMEKAYVRIGIDQIFFNDVFDNGRLSVPRKNYIVKPVDENPQT